MVFRLYASLAMQRLPHYGCGCRLDQDSGNRSDRHYQMTKRHPDPLSSSDIATLTIWALDILSRPDTHSNGIVGRELICKIAMATTGNFERAFVLARRAHDHAAMIKTTSRTSLSSDVLDTVEQQIDASKTVCWTLFGPTKNHSGDPVLAFEIAEWVWQFSNLQQAINAQWSLIPSLLERRQFVVAKFIAEGARDRSLPASKLHKEAKALVKRLNPLVPCSSANYLGKRINVKTINRYAALIQPAGRESIWPGSP